MVSPQDTYEAGPNGNEVLGPNPGTNILTTNHMYIHSRHKANVKECNHFPTLLLGTTKEHTSYLPAGTLAVTKEQLFNTIRDRMQLRWNRDQAGRRDTCFLASTHRWNPTLRSGRPSPLWGFDAATRCKNRFLWRIAQACGWSHLLGWEHVGSWQTT